MSKRKDGAVIGRPKGTKNNIRSLSEKEHNVLRCINENIPFKKKGTNLV